MGYSHRSYCTTSWPFRVQNTQDLPPLAKGVCSQCMLSCSSPWKTFGKKSTVKAFNAKQSTHSMPMKDFTKNPVRFLYPFRPSVPKGDFRQVHLYFLSIQKAQITCCCIFERMQKKEKSYRYLQLGNTMFSNMVWKNVKERSLKECQRILIISSDRFSRNSQKYQLHTHRLTFFLIQETNSDSVDLQHKFSFPL